MAQTVKIILEDDIDGGEANETVRFGLDGGQYEIDLSSANATKLRDALRPGDNVAARVGSGLRLPSRAVEASVAERRRIERLHGSQAARRGAAYCFLRLS